MGVELFPRSNVEIQTITHLVLFLKNFKSSHVSFFVSSYASTSASTAISTISISCIRDGEVDSML